MEKFKGIFPALLTPYGIDGKISKKSLEKCIKYNLDKGANGFYVGGSTGEGLILSVEERKELFKYAYEANEGKGTLIAHVGTISTDMAIDMGKYAKELGYDAISAVAPFYYGFSYPQIEGYYNEIVNAVDMPMIIYNFPNSGKFAFTKETANKIIKDERFIGIKHTSADLFQLEQFKNLDREIIVYNGFDEMLVAGLSMGADGGIGSTYNFMVDKYVNLYNSFNNGDIKKAMEIQCEVNRIIEVLIQYGVFAMEKQVLTELGMDYGICRKPFTPLTEDGIKAAKDIANSL